MQVYEYTIGTTAIERLVSKGKPVGIANVVFASRCHPGSALTRLVNNLDRVVNAHRTPPGAYELGQRPDIVARTTADIEEMGPRAHAHQVKRALFDHTKPCHSTGTV
jgi:hypothetical protein